MQKHSFGDPIDEKALQTPYYLIDENKLLHNLKIINFIRTQSSAKVLLALKCFSAWSMFGVISQYMDGTTSSSLYETRLGREKFGFGKESHAYSVAFADHEIEAVIANANMVTFNSINQLLRFKPLPKTVSQGLRLNPGVGFSNFELANSAGACSRLGEWDITRIETVLDQLDGVMIHNHCDNEDFAKFDEVLTQVEEKFGATIFSAKSIKWINLGGGVAFTKAGYPVETFCARLKDFAQRYNVQVYLEPGAAVVTDSATLEVTVLDTLFNGKDLAIVDSSVGAHFSDELLYYPQGAKITAPTAVPPGIKGYHYRICGKSCLAGDVFGDVAFEQKLQPGDRLSIQNAAEYNMVQKNWFNGVQMPSIVIRDEGGALYKARTFSFEDYVSSLS